MTGENLNKEDVEEFLGKLNQDEIDSFRRHCVKEIKDCSLPIPEEILELMKVEKETKKKKSLWEIFCNALGDDQEGHEEIWDSLTLDEKRDTISVALMTWVDLISLGLVSWLNEQVVPEQHKKKSTTNIRVETPGKIPIPDGAEFMASHPMDNGNNLMIFYKQDGRTTSKIVPIKHKENLNKLSYNGLSINDMKKLL